MMKRLLSTAVVLSRLASYASAAADTLTVKTLSLALADKLAQSALEALKQNQNALNAG